MMVLHPSFPLPGSAIDSMDKLKGHRVGVIGGDANAKIVDVLSKEYGLDRAKMFKNIALPDARNAFQSREVSALLMVIPLAEKYLSLLQTFVQQGPKALPVLIPINSAGAIAAAERAYESFDVPKGTLRGAPPVPDDDLTTLKASLYLVAQKKLGTDLITISRKRSCARAGSFWASSPFCPDRRSQHRRGRLLSAASRRGRLLQQHPAEFYGRVRQLDLPDAHGLGGRGHRARGGLEVPGDPDPPRAKARWICSTRSDAEFARPVPRPSCRISRRKSTVFSKHSGPDPLKATRTRWTTPRH